MKKRAIDVVFVDFNDTQALGAALTARPALVWIETPSNPLMRITEIAAVCRRAHGVGALVAVDNTFLSPVLQKPISLGADFVVHSTTKYLNGHSDVVGGAVIAARQEHADELAWWANCTGVTAPPFDCWLTIRGMRTLGVRIERQQASAGYLAGALAAHDLVGRVHYPGLTSHPGHAIAAAQTQSFGAMLSVELCDPAFVAPFVNALRRFTLAESLGGVESLVAHPASMTHEAMAPEARAAAGISDGLIRLSVGLEHVRDLWADLEGALATAARTAKADAA